MYSHKQVPAISSHTSVWTLYMYLSMHKHEHTHSDFGHLITVSIEKKLPPLNDLHFDALQSEMKTHTQIPAAFTHCK